MAVLLFFWKPKAFKILFSCPQTRVEADKQTRQKANMEQELTSTRAQLEDVQQQSTERQTQAQQLQGDIAQLQSQVGGRKKRRNDNGGREQLCLKPRLLCSSS